MSRLCQPSLYEAYLEYTRVQESPEAFHFWCCLAAVSLASKGARYIELEHFKVFPNIYVLLLAKSGECRKGGATNIARGIMEEAGLITPETMSERLTSAQLWKTANDNVEYYGNSTIFAFADELSLFVTASESYKELIPFLTRFYESQRGIFWNRTKTAGKDCLVNPFVVTMFGTTPTDFGQLIPGAATGTGFTPRLTLIYQETPKGKVAFPEAPPELRKAIVGDLRAIFESCHPDVPKKFQWTKEALEWYKEWYEHGNPKPADPELDGWFARKHTTLLKTAMLLTMAQTDELDFGVDNLKVSLELVNTLEESLSKAYSYLGQAPHAGHASRIKKQLERNNGQLTRAQLQHLNGYKLKSDELTEILWGMEVEGTLVKVPAPGNLAATVYKLKGRKE